MKCVFSLAKKPKVLWIMSAVSLLVLVLVLILFILGKQVLNPGFSSVAPQDNSNYETESTDNVSSTPHPPTSIDIADKGVYPATLTKTVPLEVDVIYGSGATEINTEITIAPRSIEISGAMDYIDKIDHITLGTIDLSSFDFTETFAFPIELPQDITSISDETQANVSIEIHGLETLDLSTTNIRAINVPSGYTVQIVTSSLDVKIRGESAAISHLTDESVFVIADCQEGINVGAQCIPANVYIDSISGIGALGTYHVNAFALANDHKTPYVLDNAKLLIESQIQELNSFAEYASEKYLCDIRIFVVEDSIDYGFRLAEDMSEALYEAFDLGYGPGKDCIMLLLNVADREYDLRVWGENGEKAFAESGMDSILDDYVLPLLKADMYDAALSAFLEEVNSGSNNEHKDDIQSSEHAAIKTIPITEHESNDRPDQADRIELGQSITGSLSNTYKSERDWFIFTVPNSQNTTVTLQTLRQSSDSTYWDFYVYLDADIAPMNRAAGIAQQGAAAAWGVDPFLDIPTLFHQYISGFETTTVADTLAEGTYYIRLESSNLHS